MHRHMHRCNIHPHLLIQHQTKYNWDLGINYSVFFSFFKISMGFNIFFKNSIVFLFYFNNIFIISSQFTLCRPFARGLWNNCNALTYFVALLSTFQLFYLFIIFSSSLLSCLEYLKRK